MFSVLNKRIPTFIRLPQVCRYAKFVQKSREELREELESARFKIAKNSITTALKQNKCLSVPEWKRIIAELNKHHTMASKQATLNNVIFTVLLALPPPNDAVSNARNFVEASNLGYDLNVKRRFIELYAKKQAENNLTEDEEKEIIELCNEFISSEFNKFPEMHKIITQGLCATKEWKRALQLERNVSNSSLNILIRKAIRENEIGVMWELLNNIKQANADLQYIAPKTCTSIARYFESSPKLIDKNADSFFRICESIQMVFDEKSAYEFMRAMQRSGRQAKMIKMDFSGKCCSCSNTLDAVRIKADEFELVRNEFMNKVVKGRDIYQKTTPEEWKRFERVIEENRPFDIVMDGLNVAYLSKKNKGSVLTELATYGQQITTTRNHGKGKPCAHSLAAAVEQLVGEGKRVLVLGRTHMSRWPRIDYIQSLAPVFLVDNVSKDDVFILYAALRSGPNTYILSNDYMRQHKHAIGKRFDHLFKMWQQEHWYGFVRDEQKAIKLIKPMQFKMYCHKSGDCWHLPFKSEEEIASNTWSYYELPKNWVCVRLKTTNDNS